MFSVGKISFAALYDTGATKSVMNTDLYRTLDPSFETLSPSVAVDLYDVHDRKLKTLGTASLHIKYGDEILQQQFIVTENIAEPCIFGMDGIEQHGFCQNGRDKIIFRLKPTELFGPCGSMITLSKRVSLPPHSSNIFLIENSIVKNDKDKTVENLATNETNNPPLIPSEPNINRLEAVDTSNKNDEKETIYRINHSPSLKLDIRVRPFRCMVKEKEENFIELINTSRNPIFLPRTQKIAAVNTFQIQKHETDAAESVKETNNIDLSKVKGEMRAPLRQLFQDFSDIFAVQNYDIGKTDVVEHHIDTGNHRPIRMRPYRTPFKLKQEMKTHIDEMLRNDIIGPSSSPWAAPALLVNKHDGSTRFVVDYRALNAVTKFDSYPMPRIADILDQLNNKKFFTCLDLASGYHNVCVDPGSQEKTAFVVEHGLYEYKRLPFGLVSAPASFSRLMDHILRDLIGICVLVYLDDFIIFSETEEDHLKHVKLVFDRLRKAKLKLKGKKCQFFLTEVSFLGHVVSTDGIKPDPAKIEKILNFKIPSSLKEVQSFLGLASYYRRFIENFSKTAHPLIELTKKKNDSFIWGKEEQLAFDVLRTRLTTAPVLIYPDFEKEFILFTDASNYGIAAILSQIKDERECVIAYVSRHLNEAEMKYSATEKEALAIVFGVKYFKHYLTGNHFNIVSDARPLVWLNSIKDPTGRLARWAIELSNMKYTIKYRPGRNNQNADCLSRMLTIDEDATPSESTIKKEQESDRLCIKITTYLEAGETDDPDDFPDWKKHIEFFNLHNGILVHESIPTGFKRRKDKITQIVLPLSLRPLVLSQLHDNPSSGGHFAFLRTLLNVQKRYFWPTMRADILNYCISCFACAKSKKTVSRPPLKPIDIAKGPFDVIAIDHLGPINPMSTQGNAYILMITCIFFKICRVHTCFGYIHYHDSKSLNQGNLLQTWRSAMHFK